jgi:TonB family protein
VTQALLCESDQLSERSQAREIRLNSLAERACAGTNAQGAAIALRDTEGMVCCANSGLAPALGARLQTNSGLSGECVRMGQVVTCQDTESDPRINRNVSNSLRLRSLCIVPVHSAGEVIGLLEVFSDQPDHFNDAHVLALQDMAEEVAQIADDSVTSTSGWMQEDESFISFSESATALNLRPETDTADRGVRSEDEAANETGLCCPSTSPSAVGPEAVISEMLLDVNSDALQMRIPWRSLSLGWFAQRLNPIANLRVRPEWLRHKPGKQPLVALMVVSLALVTFLSGWWLFRRNPQPVFSDSVQTPASQGLAPASATAPSLPDSTPRRVNQQVARKQIEPKPEIPRSTKTPPVPRDTIQMPAPASESAEIAVPPIVPPTAEPLKASIPIVLTQPSLPRLVPVQSQASGGELLSKVQPDYPVAAKVLNRQGTVVVKATIAKDGSVREVRVVSGDVIFRDAAAKAIKQWRYRPYYLNGQAVEAETLITLNFSGAR